VPPSATDKSNETSRICEKSNFLALFGKLISTWHWMAQWGRKSKHTDKEIRWRRLGAPPVPFSRRRRLMANRNATELCADCEMANAMAEVDWLGLPSGNGLTLSHVAVRNLFAGNCI
jgi:hypothetical protein